MDEGLRPDAEPDAAPTRAPRPEAPIGRSLAAFLLLPGIVAFGLPLVWIGVADLRIARPIAGIPLLLLGILALLGCVRDFHVIGRGTLAPWSPPTSLVRVGLYRFSRNPMYVAVLLIAFAWALTFGSTVLALYALALAPAFHLRVVFGEEPWLERLHGEAWRDYARSVPRWLGRRDRS